MLKQRPLVSLSLALVLSACASAQPPQQQHAASASAIRAAEEVGANDIPQAALHLQLAREQLAAAEKLVSRKRYDQATSLLRRAEVDAELALSLAHTKPLQERARAALLELEQLKQSAP